MAELLVLFGTEMAVCSEITNCRSENHWKYETSEVSHGVASRSSMSEWPRCNDRPCERILEEAIAILDALFHL